MGAKRDRQALTSEQQAFAAENHTVVYDFLHRNNLPVDEFYDVVIFGYLEAVMSYFDRDDLRQYSFTTIAHWSMKSRMASYYRRMYSKKEHNSTMSLDFQYENGAALYEMIPMQTDCFEGILCEDTITSIRRYLNDSQLKTLLLCRDTLKQKLRLRRV